MRKLLLILLLLFAVHGIWAQVAYLISIFGVILGFLILKEAITSKVIISMIVVILGIYIVKKGSKIKVV